MAAVPGQNGALQGALQEDWVMPHKRHSSKRLTALVQAARLYAGSMGTPIRVQQKLYNQEGVMPHKRKKSRKVRVAEALRKLHLKAREQFTKDVHAGKWFRTSAQRRIDKAIHKLEKIEDKILWGQR